MTSPAIQLARECGATVVDRGALFTNFQLETFYARAQAQALRDAAENVTIWIKELDPDERYYVREQLQRRSDELEASCK